VKIEGVSVNRNRGSESASCGSVNFFSLSEGDGRIVTSGLGGKEKKGEVGRH
jgi:hypothetical protein